MSDKDLRSQLEGLFSDIVPEPEAEKKGESLLEEVVVSPTEAEMAEAEMVKGEPMAAEALPPTPAKPEEAAEERREVPPTSVPAREGTLEEQRLRILNILLGSVTGIGAVAVGGLLIGLAQRPSRLGAYIPYFVAYVMLVGVTLARRLNPTLRATVLIMLAYIVGIFSLLRNGPLGTGGLYLLIAPLLFSILVRQRAGFIAMAVSIAVYIAFVLAHHQGWLQPAAVYDLTQLYFVLNLSGTFMMIACGIILIQWMFSRSLTDALWEAKEKHIEIIRSQTLLEERADELVTANALLRQLTLQLQTAAQVSRVATSVLHPGELVQQVVNLVCERFNLYYVGLFLVDETGRWAMLEAGTGEAGRQMLAQGHRLEVGGISMVGWCTANAQARIALDVGEEAVRFDNPLLPETRSEMALPLRSRGRVIGALDVQSAEPGAFSEGDIAVLQTMADQVAVAIDNARLLVETQASLEKMEVLQQRYVREQWAEYVPARVAPSYERTQPGVTPLGDAVLPEVEQAMAQRKVVVQSDTGDGAGQAALVAPISLRGEIIGALGLHEAENRRRWTDDEITLIEAVADQMALAIENARLFEQVQSRAARERLIREITDRVRGAVDVESILQTTVQEVGKALGASHGLVRLGTKMELGDTSDESISKEGSQGRGVGGT
jgi:GAF domain-containing protein